MRTAITVAKMNGQTRSVLNVYGSTEYARTILFDRVANGHAFPGEQVVRLPRRLGIDTCHCVSGRYIAPRIENGYRNRNVV